MGILQDLFSGGTANLVSSVGTVLDNMTTSKEEKNQLELEMKKAEMQYQVDLKRLSVEEKQSVFQDVASARKMASDVQTSSNATGLAKNISPILALGTTILTFLLFYMLLFKKKEIVENDTKDVILYILGVLSAILSQIFSFYFGSSQSSSVKNDTINRMSQEKQ